GLPAGAVFAPSDAGDTSGVFAWTPAHADAPGPYAVTFTAGNVLAGSATTTISVDRPPVATVEPSFTVNEGQTIQVQVSGGDEQPIPSLTASGLPPGASFTPDNAQNTSGTFTWTPGFTAAASSPYGVTFAASNALTGTAQTQIVVNDVDQPPTVSAQA